MASTRSHSFGSLSPSGTKAPLIPEQTRAWVQTYGRNSRIYAWGFFFLVLPIIFGIIWWDLGEINDDLLYAFGFFMLVFFPLALGTRRAATRSWVGVVEDMYTKEVRVRRGENLPDEFVTHFKAVVRTQRGKKLTLDLSARHFHYFAPGDRIFKISGLDWPEKATLNRDERICLACGNLYPPGTGQCPRCGAPEPDHGTLLQLAGIG